ncbi:MAG: alpha/beta hydrolase [Gemmataceae bacterium]
MTQRWTIVGSLALLGGLGSLVWAFVAAQDPAPAVRSEPDVLLGQVGGESLRMDLRLPAQGEGPFPAVLCIHGGGWVSGSRKQMAATLEVLARRGYVAAAPDYRLAPKHRWPACLEDCKMALRWLRAHAGRYRIDPERIGVVGLSAGGHLACMLGMTVPADGLEGTGGYAQQSSAVQAVVSLAGPVNLTATELQTEEVLTRNLQPLLGGLPREKPDAYRQASPLFYDPRNPPPFLLIHGSADRVVPPGQARELSDHLRQLGGQGVFLELPGEGHTWAGPNLTRSIDRMLTFLDESLQR